MSDAGSEFKGAVTQKFYSENSIIHFVSSSKQDASIAERFNRTLKSVIFRHFTQSKNHNWIGILPQITDGYNSRPHRAIQMPPKDVIIRKQSSIFRSGQETFMNETKKKFHEGGRVRIAIQKLPFAKGYERTFTEELFFIKQSVPGRVWTYRLQDSLGKNVLGKFYNEDLLQA